MGMILYCEQINEFAIFLGNILDQNQDSCRGEFQVHTSWNVESLLALDWVFVGWL